MEFQEPSLHNKDLIGYLNDYMTDWNLSPEALAEDIGVSSIRRWLRGTRPSLKSCEKLFDYFDVDFTERFAYYTPDGKLMFEGTHEVFLNYLDIGHHWFIALEKDGKVIRKSLPVADGECADYKAYDVSSESFNANYSRIYEAYLNDELVIRGNAKEVSKKIGVLKSSLKNHLAWTKSGKKGSNDFKVYHVGYDFKKNLEERHESITSA